MTSIPLPKELATKLSKTYKCLGTTAALFVQQVHYWTNRVSQNSGERIGKFHDGHHWAYNTYKQWLVNMPWLTEYMFRKIKKLLVELGILVVDQLRLIEYGRHRVCYYRVNYEHDFIKNDPWFIQCKDSSDSPDASVEYVQRNITKTTPKALTSSSNKTTTAKEKVVVLEKQKELKPKPNSQSVSMQNQNQPSSPREKTISPNPDILSENSSKEEKRELLKQIRERGITITPQVQRLVLNTEVEIIRNAIASLEEQKEKGNVRVPTAFLIRAIEQGYCPETSLNKNEVDEFSAWYAENKDLVYASMSDTSFTGLPDGQIGVMLRGTDKWVYWREIKQ